MKIMLSIAIILATMSCIKEATTIPVWEIDCGDRHVRYENLYEPSSRTQALICVGVNE
jgi:hypothetical protein